MAYISILKAELESDPESRGYVSMTDVEIAVDMNEPRYPGQDQLSPRAIKEYLLLEEVRGSSSYGRLEILATLPPIVEAGQPISYPSINFGKTSDPPDAPVDVSLTQVSSAKALLAICNMPEDNTLEQEDPDFDKLLNELANGGARVITNGMKTALQALTSSMVSRAQQLKIRVDAGRIQAARS